MSANEFNDHFGSEMRPDTVKLTSVMRVPRPMSNKGQPGAQVEGKGGNARPQSQAVESGNLINPDQMEEYQEMHGEFKIERGFSGMEKA